MFNSNYDIWYISQSLSHMKDKSLIDKRFIYVTFHINDKNYFEKINYDIHNAIKSMVTKTKLPLDRQPSIISSLDFENSKMGIHSSKSPHIHMLILFAEQSSEATLDEYTNKIIQILNDHSMVSKAGVSPIDVRKFKSLGEKSLNEQILNVINYNRKAKLGNDRETMVLPYYDIMLSNDNKFLKQRLEKSSTAISANLRDQSKHHLYYSKAV